MTMKKISVSRIILHIILIAMSLTYVLPLILMVSISVSSQSDVSEFGYMLIPKHIDWQAYKLALANPQQIIQSYKITILFSVIATAGGMAVQSAMAYPLARGCYKLKNFTLKYLLVTMLFNGGLVPTYILTTKYLHLGNSFWVYVIPSLFSAWNVILYKTFFQNLPDGLIEAAKIDGASEYSIYFRIVLPLSTPILATLGFTALVAKWNDWNTTLLYIRESNLYSLQYLLQKILRETEYLKSLSNTAEGALMNSDNLPSDTLKYAMAVLAAGPMLVIFPFFQKYFAKGMVVGSVKG